MSFRFAVRRAMGLIGPERCVTVLFAADPPCGGFGAASLSELFLTFDAEEAKKPEAQLAGASKPMRYCPPTFSAHSLAAVR
jgi:hypothetical protein